MTKQHNHTNNHVDNNVKKIHEFSHNTTSNFKGRLGIILLGIGIIAVSIAGYSYYSAGSNYSESNNNTANIISQKTNTSSSCSMGKGGSSCGCGGSKKTTSNTANERKITTNNNNNIDANIVYETVNVGHDEYSLVPEVLNLSAGKNYKLIITPSDDGGGCMSNMVIPGIDENVYDIIKGVPINITINNAQVGTYDVVCGNMGMYQGSIIIK